MSDENGKPDDGAFPSLLDRDAAPGLARVAVGAWWRTGVWAAQAAARGTRRLADAARSGESAAALVDDTRREVATAGRQLLGISESRSGERRTALSRDYDDEPLRERWDDLVDLSTEMEVEVDGHPAFAGILRELHPDEARILRLLYTAGPQAAVDVRNWRPLGIGSHVVAPGLNMIGQHAGCLMVERVPVYLSNLFRLGPDLVLARSGRRDRPVPGAGGATGGEAGPEERRPGHDGPPVGAPDAVRRAVLPRLPARGTRASSRPSRAPRTRGRSTRCRPRPRSRSPASADPGRPTTRWRAQAPAAGCSERRFRRELKGSVRRGERDQGHRRAGAPAPVHRRARGAPGDDPPLGRDRDRAARRRVGRGAGVPARALHRAAELGFLGLKYPVELGGQGGDYVHDAVWAEELAAAGAGGGVGRGPRRPHRASRLRRCGSSARPTSTSGSCGPRSPARGSAPLGITEPGAGSDVASIRTSAQECRAATS